MEELYLKLRSLKTANEAVIDLLENLFIPITFKKNWVLSNLTGISSANLYYISNGLIRGMVMGGKEDHCLWVKENGFIVPTNGFLTGVESVEYIEALADTTGYSLNLLRADTLARNNINMYRMLLEIYEEALLEGRQREVMLRLKKAIDRYNFFGKNFPYLKKRMTDEQQAEYLHIERKYFYSIKK